MDIVIEINDMIHQFLQKVELDIHVLIVMAVLVLMDY